MGLGENQAFDSHKKFFWGQEDALQMRGVLFFMILDAAYEMTGIQSPKGRVEWHGIVRICFVCRLGNHPLRFVVKWIGRSVPEVCRIKINTLFNLNLLKLTS